MRKVFSILMVILLAMVTHSQEIKSVRITDLEKIITESKTPLIINMWATWCIPCIEELPYFQKEVEELRKDSIQLLLVSLDFKEAFPSGIAKFIKNRKVTATVVWLDETNADYFCPKIDAKWSGAIPASLFINNKTGYRKFVEAQISQEQLKKQMMALIEKN